MVLPETVKSRVNKLNERIDNFIEKCETENPGELTNEDYTTREQDFLEIFADTCAFVREEVNQQSSYLSEVVEAAEGILSEGIEYAYGESNLFEFMPSWAHDDAAGQPLVLDKAEKRLPLRKDLLRFLRPN